MKTKLILVATLLSLLGGPLSAAAIQYTVQVNTSGLSGPGYGLDIQLNPGDSSSQLVAATISSFSLSGGTLDGAPSTIGSVSGTLPGDVQLTNGTFLNSYFQNFTPGTALSFLLTLSGPAIDTPNGTASFGSTFGLAIYDPSMLPVSSDDPTGFLALIEIDLAGQTNPITFSASGGSPLGTITRVPSTPTDSVPEPAPVLLLLAGLALTAFGRRH